MDNKPVPTDNERDNSGRADSAKVVDAEIIDDGDYHARRNNGWSGGYRVHNVFPVYGNGLFMADTGCFAAMISLFLFLACLVQWGLLAAIGFLFFHITGSIIGAFRASRYLMAGYPYNPWIWRCGNWIISFLLTAWLSGGFSRAMN